MALTTLSRVRNYWQGNIPNKDKDALLQTLIDEVSDAISRYCDRTFALTSYTEWYPGAEFVSLRQYPVKAIFYCGFDMTAAVTLRYTGSCRWAAVSCNSTEVCTTVMDTGTPLVTRYSCAAKSCADIAAAVAADSNNPHWTYELHGDFYNQPAFMLYPFASWDARVGCRLSVPALPLSIEVPQNYERTIRTVAAQGSNLFLYYEAGYTLPEDADPNADPPTVAVAGDLPEALMHLAERCVVEAYGTSVDYQYSKKVVYDWIREHAREFVPFRKLSL
jgi:hypothetical protein